MDTPFPYINCSLFLAILYYIPLSSVCMLTPVYISLGTLISHLNKHNSYGYMNTCNSLFTMVCLQEMTHQTKRKHLGELAHLCAYVQDSQQFWNCKAYLVRSAIS